MSATQRTLKGAACTVRWQPTDGDGLPRSEAGAVTVSITRADGTAVVTDQAATGTAAEERTYILTAANNLLLDLLTVTWKVATVAYATTTVEVVGGVLFTPGELTAVETSIGVSQHSPADIVAARKEVEEQFEEWCGGAFFPSFTVERCPPTSGLVFLSKPNVTAIRAVRRYSEWDSTTTDATSTELGLITVPSSAGVIVAPGSVWAGPLLVCYEHGLLAVPRAIKRAAMQWARIKLDSPLIATPDRANSYVDAAGTTIFLSRPGEKKMTGIDDIDAALNRWAVEFRLPMVR